MCGRATYKLTWEEIVALYRLPMGPPPHNFQPRFNVCPTTAAYSCEVMHLKNVGIGEQSRSSLGKQQAAGSVAPRRCKGRPEGSKLFEALEWFKLLKRFE
jgi:hypothetical protein